MDPVGCFELYISKRNHKNSELWQKPKKNITDHEEFWFDNVPVGHDTLNEAMKQLSKNAKLSGIYTNHCIWATTVTNMNNKGFKAHDIMATTSHKSECNIKLYATRCPDNKWRMMSYALATSLIPHKCLVKSTSTVSRPQEAPKDEEMAFEREELEIPNQHIADILKQIEEEKKTKLMLCQQCISWIQQMSWSIITLITRRCHH